jgi:hypothetical protein
MTFQITFFLGNEINKKFSTISSFRTWQTTNKKDKIVTNSYIQFFDEKDNIMSAFEENQQIKKIKYFFSNSSKEYFMLNSNFTISNIKELDSGAEIITLDPKSELEIIYFYSANQIEKSSTLYKLDSKMLEFDDEILFQGDLSCFQKIAKNQDNDDQIFKILNKIKENFKILCN